MDKEATKVQKMNRTIPQSKAERTRLRQLAHDFVREKSLQPPVPLNDLDALASELIKIHELDENLRDWLMVELHNGVWLPTVASIPYERRLLLLPKCLRDSGRCEGEMDDLGLLCHREAGEGEARRAAEAGRPGVPDPL